MKTIMVMPLVIVQNSQLSHNIYTFNKIFFLLYMMTQFEKGNEYSF